MAQQFLQDPETASGEDRGLAQFILVARQTTNCDGCDDIRALGAAGSVLPANYGPEQYRNH